MFKVIFVMSEFKANVGYLRPCLKRFSWCQVFDEDASYSRVTLWSSTHVRGGGERCSWTQGGEIGT